MTGREGCLNLATLILLVALRAPLLSARRSDRRVYVSRYRDSAVDATRSNARYQATTFYCQGTADKLIVNARLNDALFGEHARNVVFSVFFFFFFT